MRVVFAKYAETGLVLISAQIRLSVKQHTNGEFGVEK
jgi:hypothetical protein